MADIQIDRGEGTEEHGSAHAGHPSAREYVRIFFILGAITAVEVAIYYIRDEMGGWFLPVLFFLMGSKFVIVVLWYMHLKFDSPIFGRMFFAPLFLAMLVVMGLIILFKVLPKYAI